MKKILPRILRQVYFLSMKKFIYLFLFITIIDAGGNLREIGFGRINDQAMIANFSQNESAQIEMLKGLSAYDLMEARLNAGRQFIRDKIILQ